MTSTTDLYDCPLCDTFSFYSECQIDECLYHTLKCDVGCILLGSSVPNNSTYGTLSKQLSIAEILFYKSDYIPKATIRTLSAFKREGSIRLKTVIILYYYLEWLRNTKRDDIINTRSIIKEQGLKSKLIGYMLKRYPLNVKMFNITSAVLLLLCDANNYKTFKVSCKVEVNVEIEELLEISNLELIQLRSLHSRLIEKKGDY